MGYSPAGMVDLLKLVGGLRVALFRSHAARQAEIMFLRQQLHRPKAIGTGEAQVTQYRSIDLSALPIVPVPAGSHSHLQA
jgi:hypothetical protein